MIIISHGHRIVVIFSNDCVTIVYHNRGVLFFIVNKTTCLVLLLGKTFILVGICINRCR